MSFCWAKAARSLEAQGLGGLLATRGGALSRRALCRLLLLGQLTVDVLQDRVRSPALVLDDLQASAERGLLGVELIANRSGRRVGRQQLWPGDRCVRHHRPPMWKSCSRAPRTPPVPIFPTTLRRSVTGLPVGGRATEPDPAPGPAVPPGTVGTPGTAGTPGAVAGGAPAPWHPPPEQHPLRREETGRG